MTKQKRDYDAELAEVLALSRSQGVLVERPPELPSAPEAVMTIEWVTNEPITGELTDANA